MGNPGYQKDRDLDAGLAMTVNISRWDNVAALQCSGCLLTGGEQAEDGSGLGSGSEGRRPARHFSDSALNGWRRVLTAPEMRLSAQF